MAAVGFTPLQLYYSSTASAVPSSGNLVSGELAINIADGKLYYKDNTGVVQLLAFKGSGTVTSVSTGTGLTGGPITSTGTISLANTAVTPGSYTNANITVDAQGRLTSASNGAPGGVTSFSGGTTGLTPSTATTGAITLGGTLNVANGGTGLTSLTAGNIPYGNGTSALSSTSDFRYSSSILYTPNAILTGNLVIGASSPSSRLDVAVEAPASTITTAITLTNLTNSTQNGSKIAWRQFGGTYETAWIGTARNSSGTPTSDLVFATSSISWDAAAPTERMRITSAGNVGIGRNNPTNNLDINNPSAPCTIGLAQDQYTGAFIKYDASSNLMSLGGNAAVGVAIFGNGVDRARFTAGGDFTVSNVFELRVGTKKLFLNNADENFRGGSLTIGTDSGSPNIQLSFVDSEYEEVVSHIYQSSGLLNYDSNSLGAWPYSSAHIFRRENIERVRIQNGLSVGTTSDPGIGSITATGTISDSIGNVRSIPQTSTSVNYILQPSDNGKHINYTLSNGSVEVPALGAVSAGYVATIFNNTGTTITIYQIGGSTLRQGGTANTGNRTLSQYGVATILCVATNTYVITGTGLN